MKISRDAIAFGKVIEFDDIEQAALDAATPSAYNYNGQLEKLAAENEKLREILARLINCIYDDRYRSKEDAVNYILGYEYEVRKE